MSFLITSFAKFQWGGESSIINKIIMMKKSINFINDSGRDDSSYELSHSNCGVWREKFCVAVKGK